jgi:hypothetical protein
VTEVDDGWEIATAAGVSENATNDAVGFDKAETCECKSFVFSLEDR